MNTQIETKQAIALLKQRIEDKKAEHQKALSSHDAQFRDEKNKIIQKLRLAIKNVSDGSTKRQIAKALEEFNWHLVNAVPDIPVLNVSTETRVLNRLRMEKRDVLTISDNDEIWKIAFPV